MDSVYIVPLFCDEHSCQNGLIQQQAPCLHYIPSIQLHRLFYLGRMLGREGAARTEEKKIKIFHSVLICSTRINKPAEKHLPSGPSCCLSCSPPRCHWCRTSGTLAHAADHPKACLLSQSRAVCSRSLSWSHCSSGSPHSCMTSSPLKSNKTYTDQPQFADQPHSNQWNELLWGSWEPTAPDTDWDGSP